MELHLTFFRTARPSSFSQINAGCTRLQKVRTDSAPRVGARAVYRAREGIGGSITALLVQTKSAADLRLCRLPSADGTRRGATYVPHPRILQNQRRRATTVYSEGTWFTTFAHLFHDSLDNEPLAVWVLGRRRQKGSARPKQATTPHPHCQATFAA